MCYWVGTKNVREAMLKKRDENPGDEIAQLFYRSFVENTGTIKFLKYYVAIGKAKPLLSVIVNNGNQIGFKNLSWGLQWSYKDKNTGKEYTRELLNSTAERVFFQHRSLIFRKRCILPIDGYFEYYHFKGEVYPYFIYPADKTFFYAGGIWDSIVDKHTGEVTETFSIITTPPNELALKIHTNPKTPNGSRMLLLIPNEKAGTYLDANIDSNLLKEMLIPFPADKMKAHPVMRFQRKENIEHINTEMVRKKFHYPEIQGII